MNRNSYKSWLAGGMLACSLIAGAQNEPVDSTAPKPADTYFQQRMPQAFGPARWRSRTTYAASSVPGSSLKSINSPTLGNTLFGRLSGLYLSQTGSAPGNNDQPGLSIRGRQTFQDNGVMVLVDGFETNWSSILPEEIESVTVLKDAAALAPYGLDGANGVVLITTKRGQESPKTKIQFAARAGMHSATQLPKLLGNGDYAELYNVAIVSDGKSISNGIFRDPLVVDYYKTGQYPELYPNVDWYGEVLRDKAFSQDYNVSFSSGRQSAKYFVNMGYASYNGLYGNTDKERNLNSNFNLKRYNVRANFDVDINKYLTSLITFRGTMVNKIFPNIGEGTIWRNMALFNPFPVKTASGAWGGAQGYPENVAASILQRGYQSINDRTVDANLKLIGKLDFITQGLQVFGQVNFSNFFYDTYNKTRGLGYEELIPRPDLATPSNLMPYDLIFRGATDNNFAISQGAGNQFNRTTYLAGIEYEHRMGQSTVYASSMYYQELYKANGADMPFATQRIMGRVQYSLRERYLAEFGYSYSGSENYPKGRRFGFFPAVSAGWLLHKESFLANSRALSFLKLRGSVGMLGNDRSGNSGRFIFNQYYNGTGTYFLGNNLSINAPMFNQGTLANPNVTWEKALKANIGFDAVLFRKLSVSADLFSERRTDIFVPAANSIPAIVGVISYNLNLGETKNRGAELELQWTDRKGKLEYSFGGYVNYARNEIVNIQEPARPYDYLYARGNAINQPFVLEAIGFFSSQSDIDNSPRQLFGDVRPGDVKYKDQNGDGFIDDNDRKPIGNTAYPALSYAFNGGVNFRGFDLGFLFQGAGMRTVSLLDNNIVVPFLNGGVRPTQWVKNHFWTADRGDAALYPRLTTEANPNNYRPSTLWQRDGSFLRLRNLELGYTLPQHLLRRAKLESVRVYLTGNNLFTWDKIDEIDVDPEIMNIFTHPALKSFSFGVNIGL